MSADVNGISSLHQDHCHWESEHSMWQQDLDAWNKELAIGLAELEDAQRALEHQKIVLVEHTNLMAQQKASLKQYQHELATESAISSCADPDLRKMHLEMRAQSERMRSDHQRIKKYQHELIVRLRELEKAIQSSM